jgi:hypothetical protein
MTATKKVGLGVYPGDVYTAPLPDGRFGAVRVIEVMKDGRRRGRDSATLVCTRYIGAQAPAIDDPALRKVLRRNRFRFRDAPAVMITDKPPPSDFVRVGNFAPTSEERAIDPMGTCGSDWQIIRDVLLEWRWEHDREALEQEVRSLAAARDEPKSPPGPREPTPGSKLTETGFWTMIGTLADGELVDAELVEIARLVNALARRSTADIREFHELLAHKLYLLDARRFAEHAGAAGGSDDLFLYARCYVVARGRAFYEDVLAHPDHFPADVDLEALLSVAPDAFVARTDEDLDEGTHYSYETGSNVEGWRS